MESPTPSTSSACNSSTSKVSNKQQPLFYCCLDCYSSFSTMLTFVEHCRAQHQSTKATDKDEDTAVTVKKKKRGRKTKAERRMLKAKVRRISEESTATSTSICETEIQDLDLKSEESKPNLIEIEDVVQPIENGRSEPLESPEELQRNVIMTNGDFMEMEVMSAPPTSDCTDLEPATTSGPFEVDFEKYYDKCLRIGDKEVKVNMGCPLGERHLMVQKSRIHGRGLFTGNYIRKGEIVIEYTGELVSQEVALARQQQYDRQRLDHYIMRFGSNLYMDATVTGNCARFINNSCNPNCATYIIDFHGGKKAFVYTLRNIMAGEELTYDYRFESDELVACCCGYLKCRGALNWNVKTLKLPVPNLRKLINLF